MQVSVLGAGTMGHGIAQVSAMAGHEVTMRDIEMEYVQNGLDAIEENLQGGVDRDKVTPKEMSATLDRISGTTSLDEAVADADLVVEAVPEDMDLKRDTVSEVESLADEETIIASNTSSLSVTEIMSALDRPERGVGLHFFNPVHIMGLVEVVVAEQTDEETLTFANDFVEGIDKTAVQVGDSPGFASSRLGVALGVEAMRMVQEGVASSHDIDDAMELGYNHPMGPIELGDVVGLDVRLGILEYLREELGERFRPPQILKRKVRAGKLGKKTGEGFYVWEDGEIVGVSEDVMGR
ncbi:3-hydroxyacyl-CoA dehydrogenase family protein (plasmid) [Haloferax mediterranei ATCC 33500]|uniref:3-hydroxyacyl-CoA dehydrogenase n=1 Tax=Haloferax mediterranei (strain ATCC 33500 / DSM 1411 / JCM 8866 / NBRC 14739 / NCIMB 2177 / R-4) TaxID=523841 RepID=I3RB66_HALMT|nr:3-hydroxyacyl-CoA dehydrogenase family protein [Haloferax mediterranei]AFK21476.2 3-hydroxyacyl-CoA dehydrogenase [Haloferax mediterranei ATCC 33500]AHZ24462.1 3-hydroxybutyryl-CoA dehydrogenase [Haloferax mediterranei ATCC 33500]ELZ97209.1 3-hydroxyacyl-CoA dehydrogenase [Haloferax mediterranei ATCC 33500]MDX5990053.1 3-hydroxyacyl-CoA dehydrogenase family protein [Haloferax mediterranei ATCC 33500]QCQ76860.1 3-hydroxyacyl-CoA dehydrogenase family protein [Haloferax mediterranei ATCC 33500